MPRITCFVVLTMLVTPLHAGQTPPSSPPPSPREDPKQMLSQCEMLLQGSLQLRFGSPPSHPPVTEAHRAAATRARDLVTTAAHRMLWVKGEGASPFHNAWRSIIIDILGLCTYARVLERSQQPHEPLPSERIDLLLEVFRQSEVFLTDLNLKSSEIKKHSDAELKAPAIEAAQIISEEWQTPCNEFGGLPEKVIDWALCNHITPVTISRLIILALRVPKDGPASNSDPIRKRLLEQNLKQCEDLGTSVLNCALLVANASLKGLTLVAAKGAISTARLGRAQLGARMLAEIEDDNSRAVPIAHRIAQAWEQNGAETEEEKRALRIELEATLGSFLKLPLLDLSGLVTFISGMIWEEHTRALQHLLFFHLPKIVKPPQSPHQPAELCVASARMAEEVGLLAQEVASAYLWQDTDPDAHFRPIFLEVVQAAAKHIAYGILTSKGDCDPTENALRSARLLTMLHLFLEHHAAGEYDVEGFDKDDVEAPLVDLVHQILPHYFPNDEGLKEASGYLTRRVVRTFLDTFLSSKMVFNVLISLEMPNIEVASAPEITPGAVEVAVAEERAHSPLGKALVRTVRSFLKAQKNLGVINKSLVGVVNRHCDTIGKKILEGDSADVLPVVRALLLKKKDGAACARPFADWIDDEDELKERFCKWKQSVCEHIDKQVKEAPLAARLLYKFQFSSLLPTILEQTQDFILSTDKYALSVLMLHYLLPIWRVDIVRAMRSK